MEQRVPSKKEWDFILVKDQSKRIALTQADNVAEAVPDGIKKDLERYETLTQKITFPRSWK